MKNQENTCIFKETGWKLRCGYGIMAQTTLEVHTNHWLSSQKPTGVFFQQDGRVVPVAALLDPTVQLAHVGGSAVAAMGIAGKNVSKTHGQNEVPPVK